MIGSHTIARLCNGAAPKSNMDLWSAALDLSATMPRVSDAAIRRRVDQMNNPSRKINV